MITSHYLGDNNTFHSFYRILNSTKQYVLFYRLLKFTTAPIGNT